MNHLPPDGLSTESHLNNKQSRINSSEKSSHWLLVIIGIVFLLVSSPIFIALPEELAGGKYEILLALIFPLAGLGMCFGGWRMRQKFLFFGATPLMPSPYIGQVGGQMGGRIELKQAWEHRSLSVFLQCVHIYTSGSGKNSNTHRDILWQEENRPVDKPHSLGSALEFCFDVPADLPLTGKHKRKGNIHWEVIVEGEVCNREFRRHWKLPVEAGTTQSKIIIPERHKIATQEFMRQQAEVSAAEQIQIDVTLVGLNIISDQGRNKSMSYFLSLFGAIFSAAGVFLFYQASQGEAMLWLMAPIFFLVGFCILAFGVFLLGRKLECKIIDHTVHVRRSLFGKILYTREGPLTSASQLNLKSTMSSQQGSKKIEYMALYAQVDCADGKPRMLKLVEGVEGRRAGEAMERKVAEALKE